MLTPYRVLDLTDDRGHLAGFLMAQMGADVIAVEPPGGARSRHLGPWAGGAPDPERSLGHWAYNRGKRSIVADGHDAVAELAAGADVLFECGAIEVDLDALRAANPGLITVSLSPFGADGPKADWVGTDLTLSAASGEMSLNGYKDRAYMETALLAQKLGRQVIIVLHFGLSSLGESSVQKVIVRRRW